MRDYQIVSYAGAAPGADANTYTLFDSTLAPEFNGLGALPFRDFRRYVLSLKNSGTGTLKGYVSENGGASWGQFFELALGAATTPRNNDVAIPCIPHLALRVDWVNGGAAQSTWRIAQGLDDGRMPFKSSFVDPSGEIDPGDSQVVTSPQLPASLGQKAAAASLAVVLASDQTLAQLPASLGQKAATASLPVVLASDDHLKGVKTPTTSVAEAANMLALGIYNLSPPTLTDGQLVPPQLDASGYLRAREQYTDIGSFLPVFSVALATKLICKAAAGVVRKIDVDIDGAAGTATYYLWLINAVDVLADTTAISSANALINPRRVVFTTGTAQLIALDFGEIGIPFSVGLTLGLSSTRYTFTTVASAWLSATAWVR